jgi:hypothetical protein
MYRIILPALFIPGWLAAQEFRGTILGRVNDPTGAAVPNATIEAINVNTGTINRTTSNEAGNYQIPFLLPGAYKITAEAAGFKKIERSDVQLTISSLMTVDFTFELGTAAESITVTTAPPLLDLASGDLAQVVTREFVETIEFSTDRNVASLALLSPGVNGTAGGTYTAGTHAQISINGGGGVLGRNEYLIDGIPNTTAGGGVVFIPSIDSVDEFKVHTTMFDASLGHTNGGVISMTTKSGSNQLHGTGYWYNRGTALQANSWINNRNGNPRAPTKYNQFGYAVSGPVFLPKLYDGRNRTFFSTSLERDNDNRPLTPNFRVPTVLEKQGDFSQTLNRLGGPFAIYDPNTTVGTGNTATRTPFPGARIPANRIDPIGRAMINIFPDPTRPEITQIGAQNWSPPGYYNVKQRNYMARIDHNVSDRQRLFGRYGLARRIGAPGQLFYLGYAGGNVGIGVTDFTNIGVDDTITFSPTLVGTLRLGIVRNANVNRIGAAGSDPKELNLPDIIARNQFVQGWPFIIMGEGFPNTGSRNTRGANDMYSLVGSFSKLSGPMSFKFGYDYRLQRWNTINPGDAAVGSFTYNSTFTRANPFVNTSSDTSGTAMASLLMATPASGSLGYVSPLSTQNHYFALYAQNDWKATRRLTLNFGLRWDLETPYTERFNRQSYAFDEDARLPLDVPGYELRGGLLFAGVGGNPRRGGPLDTNNFGPRFGFAFQLDDKTVLRGGYGIFYSVISNNSGFRNTVDTFNTTTPYIATNDAGASIATTLNNPFPNGLQAPVGSGAGLLAQIGEGLTIFDHHRVNPYNQQWQLSIQRELPARILVEVAYVGVHALKLLESYNLNEKPDQYLALGTAENTRVPNPFWGIFPTTTTLGNASTITQNRLWVRYPQFTSLTLEGANTGRTIYHAGQIKVDKRLSHGLNAIFGYTFSKLIDNNTTSLINERHYRSVSPIDQTHVARMALVYQTPFRWRGGGWDRVVDYLLGGWRFSAHVNATSGDPLSVTHANGRPIRLRPAALSGPVNERLGRYFDTTAFAPLPNQYTVTPEPPTLDDLRGPANTLTNLQLFKQFPIGERVRLEFDFQADNAFNTPQWANPATNMSNLATFGVISDATNQRTIMTALRVRF